MRFAPHQERVADNFAPESLAWTVALYHDHLEDGLGPVPTEALDAVQILTRRPGERYFDYIRRVRDSGDRMAIAVKRADLFDNLARSQGEHGGTKSADRVRRYTQALEMLEGH